MKPGQEFFGGVLVRKEQIQIISDRLSALVTLVPGLEQEVHLPPMKFSHPEKADTIGTLKD